MRNFIFAVFFTLFTAALSHGQTDVDYKSGANIPLVILKAEDARDYNADLERLLDSPNEKLKNRAMLSAGRIGDERALPKLIGILENGSTSNRVMAAFAIGEIESVKGADAILKALADTKADGAVRAHAVEAAGKIAAANPKDPKAAELGKAIIAALEFENGRRSMPNREAILLGLTAILRARPEGGDAIAAKFLDYSDARIKADALNTLARLRAKNVNAKARELLAKDADPIVRANAARVLGAAEDKEAVELLLNVAKNEHVDSRVRVSTIRALGNLKDPGVIEKLLPSPAVLAVTLAVEKAANASINISNKANYYTESKNEHLELAALIGRLLPNTNDEKALYFLKEIRKADNYSSPETEIAFAKIAPEKYLSEFNDRMNEVQNWRTTSAYAQGLAELANSTDPKIKEQVALAVNFLIASADISIKKKMNKESDMLKAYPDLLRAYAAFKPASLAEDLKKPLKDPDVFIRATAAELMSELPVSPENIKALKEAFSYSLVTDKHDNDAILGIMDALYKLDKNESVGSLLTALSSPDYLVRKKAFDLLKDESLQKDFPGLSGSLNLARGKRKNNVMAYDPASGTKLGQVLNTDANYRRALSRKNGQVKAIVKTVKGDFTIEFFPEDAPLTVDNFIKLAKSGYFNGLSVHRVVPNFVMQDGDPRGDGNGGPGWSIRCEVNTLSYERGMVGMALSGKDTGGSQWFVTHSPQPHLDGGYTIFGKVNETGMKVVDSIARGDTILSIKVIGDGVQGKRKRN